MLALATKRNRIEGGTLSLLMAVEANNLATVSELIKRGADINKRGPLPYTPLMMAAGRGYVQMTDMLLAAGADVHALDSSLGASALHKAAQSGAVDVTRLLLHHGAFINLQSATVGHTPLIDAVWAKKSPMVKFLLDQGAAITIRTHYQGTVWDFIGKEPRRTAGGTIPETESWGTAIRAMLEARQKADEEAAQRKLLSSSRVIVTKKRSFTTNIASPRKAPTSTSCPAGGGNPH